MTITPRKRRITEALKPHLRHGRKTELVDAVDALLAEAEQAERERCIGIFKAWFGNTIARNAIGHMVREIRRQGQAEAAAIRARGQGQAEAAEDGPKTEDGEIYHW